MSSIYSVRIGDDAQEDAADIDVERRFSPVAEERSVEYCECVMDIVAALFGVDGRQLRQPGRSSSGVSRVRQIGMYVAHVVLSLSMAEVGRGFGRDRAARLPYDRGYAR